MNYIELDEVDSTNEYVKRNIDKLPDFSVVRCNHQTAGHGRNGHIWESQKGQDLLMSILIKEFKNPQDLYKLAQIASCSVVELLDRYGIEGKIKWPNDIYVDDLKICGILVEALHQDESDAVVIGIGLNVNSISGEYASMKMKMGQNYLIKPIMITILTYFKIYYNLYQQDCYDQILDDANDISYLKNKRVQFQDYGLVTFTKLNEDGTVDFVDSNYQKYKISVNDISLHRK